MAIPQMKRQCVDVRWDFDGEDLKSIKAKVDSLIEKYGNDSVVDLEKVSDYCGGEESTLNLYYEVMETQEEADLRAEADTDRVARDAARDRLTYERLKKQFDNPE